MTIGKGLYVDSCCGNIVFGEVGEKMRKKFVGILVTILMLIVSMPLGTMCLADWDPKDGHKMHWPQTPDPNGWDVQATYDPNQQMGIVCADDWRCSESGWIKAIHWWGSWRYNEIGTITSFVITISDNIPADEQIPWSRPGQTLVEYKIYPGEWTERGPFEGVQGWYEPQQPSWWPNDHTLYWQYNWFLDEKDWFWQEKGKIYWLSISAVVSEAPSMLWGWKSTTEDLHFMDDGVWSWWWNLNWFPLTYPNGATMDLAFVINGGTEPCVEIDKKVWDEKNHAWVEEIDADVCTEVEFKIEVHNCGDVNLTNIQVVDTLPDCLEYVDGSSTVNGQPSEPDIQVNKMKWSLPGPLKPCNTITIKFKAHVISTGENINTVKVTASHPNGIVTDTDTAIVNGIGAASIDVEKKVSKDGGITWTDEVDATVCTTVRFRITVHNDGDYDLTNIKVVDTLPDCLEYKDNAIPNEPIISGNKLTWTFPGPLKYCNTIAIEFDAHVKTEGENENTVTATADYAEGTVSDTDTAVVHATSGNNPPLKPQTPYKKAKPKPITATKTITLCTKTTDPDGDDVYYWWDFGDGTTSGWLGPYSSGNVHCTPHTYTTSGTYSIKVKAKDVYGAESPWSDPLTLRVTTSKTVNLQFLALLQKMLDSFPLLKHIIFNILIVK